jgi:hypothetical protein
MPDARGVAVVSGFRLTDLGAVRQPRLMTSAGAKRCGSSESLLPRRGPRRPRQPHHLTRSSRCRRPGLATGSCLRSPIALRAASEPGARHDVPGTRHEAGAGRLDTTQANLSHHPMSFIDPIRYPVAAAEAATRAIRDQAAAAYRGGPQVPQSVGGPAVLFTRSPEQSAQLAAENRAALVRWEADRARSRPRILAITDPSERLAMACRHWLVIPDGYDPLERFMRVHRGVLGTKAPKVEVADLGLFATAFPQYWPDETSVNLDAQVPPWDSGELARWFAARARAARIPSHKIDKIEGAPPGRFLRPRRSARGWQVKTTRWRGGGHVDAGAAVRVALLADGRLADPTAHISAVGMVELADLLNLGNPQLVVGSRPPGDGERAPK